MRSRYGTMVNRMEDGLRANGLAIKSVRDEQ
jgi:hypothetical protein